MCCIDRLNGLLGLLFFAFVANASGEGLNDRGALPEIESCSAWMTQRTSGDSPAIEKAGLRTLCVDLGSGMNDEIVQRFIDQIKSIPRSVAPHVVVRSLGGDVENGMKMGEAILDRGAAVHVFGFCASSCANYIFLAGTERHVMLDSVVFFHGGIISQTLQSPGLTVAGRTKVGYSLERQAQLLKRAGIDSDFFETMDKLNGDEMRARICPDKPSISVLVLSDARLADAGADVTSNLGPQSQDAVEHVLANYGLANVSCYWR